MTLHYDLHSHSTASDGTLSPTELVTRAARQGVDVLALTDHDVTDGLNEALAAAEPLAITLLPGVEVSVTWQGKTLHIVGLGIDHTNAVLQQGLAQMRTFRDWRAAEMARRLEKHGVDNAYAGASAYASGTILSRTHFARYLIERGHASDMGQVFKRFLTQGKPGYVPGEWATLPDALHWINSAGGQAVIAHPARYKLTATRLRQLLGEFKQYGGAAIEVVSGSHSRDDYHAMANYAKEFGLLSSCGTDYHGPEQPWLELGRLPPLPKICVPVWSAWENLPH